MGYLYLGLAFVGAIAPYSFLGQFLLAQGLNFNEFKALMAVNSISSFLGAAFIIASVVTFLFIFSEGRRLKMKGLWLPLLATILVGVSCGLPLFLYLREMARDRQ